jgi:integrase
MRTVPVEYAVAVDWYLGQDLLSPASRRVYRISLTGWAWPLVGKPQPPGRQRRGARPPVVPLALLDSDGAPARLSAAVTQRAGRADARTVNRELSALRSAIGWWLDLGWIARDPTSSLRHLGGGPVARPARPALSDQQVAAAFGRSGCLRDQALWRLLSVSGVAVERVLALDADRVDLTGHRSKTAAGEPIRWDSQTSLLLTWLLAGRPCGPVFLTERRAPAGTPRRDLCPVTGQARMSYRRAAEIFTSGTRQLDPAGRGWTLHQLRRPAECEARQG